MTVEAVVTDPARGVVCPSAAAVAEDRSTAGEPLDLRAR